MKKKIIILGIVMFYVGLNPILIGAEPSIDELSPVTKEAKAALLLERDTGTVLYEKNAHEKLPPASMTKIMTLLLTMEAIEQKKIRLDEVVTISERAASMGGSQVFLAPGEEITVENLIKSIAIASANDASVAIAERIAGSEEAFVQRMNDKLVELDLKNTKFQNSSGLPAKDHFTTAYDMALIAKELLKYEEIVTYTSIYDDYLRKGEENEFWLVNTNKLVRFHPYIDGLKTGYTKEAQFCLTASAIKDDMRVVTVVMGADTSKNRNAIVSSLVDYAFNHYEAEKVYAKDETIATLTHVQAKKQHYDVKTSEKISVLHKKGTTSDVTYQTEITMHEIDELPIKIGQEVGTLKVITNDKTTIESPLIVTEPVERATIVQLMKRTLKQMTKYAVS